MDEASADKKYVLVIKDRYLAFGPFASPEDAEYAAQDYYGTAVTGASMRDAFLVAELQDGDAMADRQRDNHVAALLASDV